MGVKFQKNEYGGHCTRGKANTHKSGMEGASRGETHTLIEGTVVALDLLTEALVLELPPVWHGAPILLEFFCAFTGQ